MEVERTKSDDPGGGEKRKKRKGISSSEREGRYKIERDH